jgi:sortase (surface protein transpeptidase)
VSSPVIGLGLNADKTLEVPPLTYAGTHETGWYKLGPAPGQIGAAVIVGHVDSTSGPAVFSQLAKLKPGSAVEVIAVNCQTSTFVVTSVEEYPKSAFPTQKIYGPTSDAELRLITCGGSFDPATGHYSSNIVAYARTVSTA